MLSGIYGHSFIMNTQHYLNYAVYMTSHGDYLVKVEGGYFASEAFMKGDKEYNDVAGTKFGGIFGDDGKSANCSKYSIRRLASDEEFDKLWKSSCTRFKQNVIVLNALIKVSKGPRHYEAIREFKSFGGVDLYFDPDEIPTEESALEFAEKYLSTIK